MSKQKSVIFLVLAASLSSLGGICVRLSPWTVLSINGARGIIAAFITLLYLINKKQRLVFSLETFAGGISLCLTMCLYVQSVKLAGAANAILLMYTSPIFVLLYMCVFKGKKATLRDFSAIFCVIIGVLVLVSSSLRTGSLAGNLFGLASGCAYAGVFLVNTGKSCDAMSSYFLGQLLAGLIGLPFVFSESIFSPRAILCAIVLGVFQLGLAYIFMAEGIKNTPPLTASLVTCIEPILSPLWIFAICGESISPSCIVGAVCVLSGVLLHSAKKQALIS